MHPFFRGRRSIGSSAARGVGEDRDGRRASASGRDGSSGSDRACNSGGPGADSGSGIPVSCGSLSFRGCGEYPRRRRTTWVRLPWAGSGKRSTAHLAGGPWRGRLDVVKRSGRGEAMPKTLGIGFAGGIAPSRRAVARGRGRKLFNGSRGSPPGPAQWRQRTGTSWRSIGSQPAVSRRLFRCFKAHLPRSLWTVTVNGGTRRRPGGWGLRRHTACAERLGPLPPDSCCRRRTSSRCRAFSLHRCLRLPFQELVLTAVPNNKKPCFLSVSRVWKNLDSFFATCPPPACSKWLRVDTRQTPGSAHDGAHRHPGAAGHGASSLRRPSPAGTSG